MTSPFHRAYREELLKAAYRDQRRRRWRLRGLVGSLTAALAAGTAVLWPSPATAEVEVEVDGGFVEVRLLGAEASGEEVLDALDDAGIEAAVEEVPTGPSNVGRFTAALVTGASDAPQVAPLEQTGTSFAGFRLPEGWPGELVIEIGREARPGEAYHAFVDAFADEEPLRCQGIFGTSLREAAPELSAFSVAVINDTADVTASLAEALDSDLAAWFIAGGRGLAEDRLQLTVAPQPPPEEQC
jgi:hypothetical protein